MTLRQGPPSALLLTAALHLALLLALLSPQQRPARPQADDAAIQWLLPAPALAARPAPPSRQASPPAAARAQRLAVPFQAPGAAQVATPAAGQSAAPAVAPAVAPFIAPSAAQAAAQAQTAAQDPFAAGAPPASTSVAPWMLKSGYGAGAVDRELRGGKAAQLTGGGNVLQGKIDEAFSAAVRRKGMGPATIQEISTPSDRVRVYKMTTGGGTVCISMPDPSLEKTYRYTITNCPRENARGDVSPAIAKLPRAQP